MIDHDLRWAVRAGDPTALLAARLRAGDVSPERVALAAALGHAAALELSDPAALPGDPRKRAQAACEALGKVESVRWACDLADRALAHAWTDSSDPRPAKAVAAARAWADCPCEAHRAAAARGARATLEPAPAATAAAVATAWAVWTVWEVWAAWAGRDAVRSGAVTWPEAHAMLAERLLRGEA